MRAVVLVVAAALSLASHAKIATDAPLWAFTEGERLVFRKSSSGAAQWIVRDWRGREVRRGEWPAAGVLSLDPVECGYYTAECRGADGVAEKFSFGVFPRDPCRDPDSYFAVDAAFSQCSSRGTFDCPWYCGDTYRAVAELMGKCGVTHNRERSWWHKGAFRKRGKYDPSAYLESFRLLAENGSTAIGFFSWPPAWTKSTKGIPDDFAELYRAAAMAAKTFKGKYEAWEYMNEPELSSVPAPVWEVSAAQKAFALAVRSVDRDAALLPASMSAVTLDYCRALFENDLAKFFNAFNLHTYHQLKDYPKWHSQITNFLAEAGIPTWQTWLTECGTHCEGEARIPSVRKDLMMHSPEQEMKVAEFCPKSAILNQMGPIFRNWYFMFGTYHEMRGAKDWGTIRRDGTLKPICPTIATLTHVLGGAELLGEVKATPAVRVFLYRRKDGRNAVAYWADDAKAKKAVEFSLPASDGRYEGVDMVGMRSKFAASGGALRLSADKYVAYAIGDFSSLKVDVPPMPKGELFRYKPRDDEDLSVVVFPRVNLEDFEIDGRKVQVDFLKESGRVTMFVHNLSGEEKSGRVGFEGMQVEGGDVSLVLPPWGMTNFTVVLRPLAASGVMTNLLVRGIFNGRKTSVASMRVCNRYKFIAECAVTPVATADAPSGWRRNDSADEYEVSADEAERAVKFHVKFGRNKGFWFYPIHELKVPEEAMDGVNIVTFEVKSEQNKVENDFSWAYLMLVFEDGTSSYLPYLPPTFAWSTRYVPIPRLDKKVTAIRLGANPKGSELTMWFRNLRFLK